MVSLLIVAMTCLFCLPACQQSVEDTPPRLHVSKTEHDFGQVLEPAAFTHKFIVHNTGGDTLIIDKVKPGSGGGWAEFNRVIAPGDSGQVLLGISGEMVTGRFKRIWSINSNDPGNRTLTFSLTGEKIHYVKILPADRTYLRGKVNERIEETLTVASHNLDPGFEVQSISSNIDDKIAYRLEEGNQNGEWRLYVSKRSDYRIAGSQWGILTLRTNHPSAPERTIQVNVNLEGEISVEPSTINYGHISTGRLAKRETVKISRDGGGFKLTGWEADAEEISARIEETDPGRAFKVHVTFTPTESTSGSIVEMLYIHTNDPEEPTVSVRLIARMH